MSCRSAFAEPRFFGRGRRSRGAPDFLRARYESDVSTEHLFRKLREVLEFVAIPYMVTGSFVSADDSSD